ncbi:hypothetical protein ACFX2I_043692 [Malus domestica]
MMLTLTKPDSPSDSLRDIQDISLNLKLSLDGDKTEGSAALDNALEAEDHAAGGKTKEQNAVLTLSKGVCQKPGSTEKADNSSEAGKFLAFRKRKYVCVIAVDCDTTSEFTEIIEKVTEAVGKDRDAGPIGFILSTALGISEIHSLLISGGLSPSQFDAFICNSGGELYYPSSSSEDSPSGLPFVVDIDYCSHIEYHWGAEGLRKTLVRWVANFNEKKGRETVTEDVSASTNHCYAYKVKDPELLPPVKELRKLMRIQALRCHVIYSLNGTRLNVIPVLASRSQALRYLYVRWGLNLSTAVVFVGESGDTDYEGSLGGLHKTVILKGVGIGARKLHANRNYPLEHVFPNDSPNMAQTEGCSENDIRASLVKLGILKR